MHLGETIQTITKHEVFGGQNHQKVIKSWRARHICGAQGPKISLPNQIASASWMFLTHFLNNCISLINH